MNEREMFEKSFQRPKNFFSLSSREQWSIDKRLGLLDWRGEGLTDEDKERFRKHYNVPKKKTGLKSCVITLALIFLLCPAGYAFEKVYTLPITPETISEYTRFCKMMDKDPETCLKRQRHALKQQWTVKSTRGVEDIHRYFGMCIAKNRGLVGHGFVGDKYVRIWVWDAYGTLECITKVQEKDKKRRSKEGDGDESLKQESDPNRKGQGGTSPVQPAI